LNRHPRQAKASLLAIDHEQFMRVALDLAQEAAAQGNRPLGPLIVAATGDIVARGGNRVFSDVDPTAHGEMVVIREPSRKLHVRLLRFDASYPSRQIWRSTLRVDTARADCGWP
jgi:hypothetical protein